MDCNGCAKTTTGRQMYCQACFQCMDAALTAAREELTKERHTLSISTSCASRLKEEKDWLEEMVKELQKEVAAWRKWVATDLNDVLEAKEKELKAATGHVNILLESAGYSKFSDIGMAANEITRIRKELTAASERANIYKKELDKVRKNYEKLHKKSYNIKRTRAFKTCGAGVETIVFATNRSKAQYTVLRNARSAGYRFNFLDVKCKRAPEYDRLYQQGYEEKCWDPQVLNLKKAVEG